DDDDEDDDDDDDEFDDYDVDDDDYDDADDDGEFDGDDDDDDDDDVDYDDSVDVTDDDVFDDSGDFSSWAGHDTLVGELETRCLQTMTKEPSMWRHSKHRGQYPVRIDASFARFTGTQLGSPIKVLSTGRPIRPVGSFQPMLYIYALSNNHTEYATGGGRNKIASWLGHLQAGNISDWVILMIDADAQTGGPKMWQRSTVIQRIKKDFNINQDGL
ncbi:hypothetical protein FGIG_03974, partial [Fasciola gigantica]